MQLPRRVSCSSPQGSASKTKLSTRRGKLPEPQGIHSFPARFLRKPRVSACPAARFECSDAHPRGQTPSQPQDPSL